ncbi:MAG: hypothetical protein QXK72_05560 [Candidatus Bathyarchaeia archaeon]
MAVRVRLLISHGDRHLEVVSLVNSGFETDTPQLLLPKLAAEKLGFQPPAGALRQTYDTAGGPADLWVYPESVEVKILAGKKTSRSVKADVVISPIESESLIGDRLCGELRIVVEDFGEGLWRLRGERRPRRTERPQLWTESSN